MTLRTRVRRLRGILAGLAMAGLVLFAMWAIDTLRVRLAQPDAASAALGTSNRYAPSSTDAAVAALQARLMRNERDQVAYTLLGAAYLQKARETGDPSYYGKAEGVLQRALELEPGDFAAMIQIGSLSLARHQFREALDWGLKAKAVSPDTAAVYGVIGDAFIELGQYDAAEKAIQTMVDLRPDLSSYSRASYLRELTGDVEGAIEAMSLAVEAGGPNAENTNWTRVQLGHLYFNAGRLDQAEAQYHAALDAYPGYVHATAGLARIRAARGDYDDAIRLYTDVVNRMPLVEYVAALGDVYEAAGRPAEARRQFDLARAIEKLYVSSGVDTDLEMALFTADHADRLEAGSIDDALARAHRALEKRPTIFAKDALAWTLYQAGQVGEAYALSQAALALGTQDALLHFHAGLIAKAAGRPDEAQAYLESALALNPNFSIRYRDLARSTLEQLRQSAQR